ncbi:harmonin-binding protein USHBP1 isoform 1-T2 [Thomomys bottae]
MSARTTRPRSRRRRPTPPGELDPVAESSEEAEAVASNARSSAGPAVAETRPEPLEPRPETSGQEPGNRTDQATDGDSGGGPASAPEGLLEPVMNAQQPPKVTSPDRGPVLAGPGAPDVFHTVQQVLSSLEAAVAARRGQAPGGSTPALTVHRHAGGPEGAGVGQRKAAQLSERNAWLRLALESREAELLRTQAALQALQAEKETLQGHVQELQESLRRLESSPPMSPGHAGSPGSDSSGSGADWGPWGARDSSSPAPLLQLRDSSSQIPPPVSTSAPKPTVKLLEGRAEQLWGSLEKLKCFNRLLLAVLQGFKGRCEELSMQLGTRAAEATALRLALQDSESCEEAFGALLALWEADPARGGQVPRADLQLAQEEACRLLAQMEATMDGGTPQRSPEGSSVDKPTPQEVATQLQGCIQRLQERRALLKIPREPGPSTAARLTALHGEAMVQAILETQPGPALPHLEKTDIQQDVLATRETLVDLMLQLQLLRREKRGLELREAALRAQGPAHALLLEQLQWEKAQLEPEPGGARDSGSNEEEEEEEWPQGPPALPVGTDEGQLGRIWDPEKLSQELAASLTRSRGLQQQVQSLRQRLEQAAQRGRASRAQCAELHRDLCKAHSALVLAFRGAHRKQEEQRRKLERQLARLGARQAEELARLEAAARAPGAPRPPRPSRPPRAPPRPAETLL